MKETYLCMDVGGTEIKAAAITADGQLYSAEIRRFPAMADKGAEVIINHLAEIVYDVQARSGANAQPFSGVRIAFPGPFDYSRGICLMKGLDKFDAIYGIRLGEALSARIRMDSSMIRFQNDASAFGLGEAHFGAAAASRRTLCVCIGTGCGSAFLVDGKLVGSEVKGVPPQGYIYNEPFLDSRIDDILSKRGLSALSLRLLGRALEGRALAEAAHLGDFDAIAVWKQFGIYLRDALLPFLTPSGFHPDSICLGGQIMKSGDLFLSALKSACAAMHVKCNITEDTSLRTMQGLTLI